MKAWVDELINEKFRLQLVPLIDCVFVLLIYFMVCRAGTDFDSLP